jgi:hypothetical protein
MVEICRAEYDRLIEQSPPIPKDVLEKFDKRFDTKNTPISTPEILTIKEIKPFDNIRSAENINKVVEKIFKKRRSESIPTFTPRHVNIDIPKNPTPDPGIRQVIAELENLKELKLVSHKTGVENEVLDCENEIFANEAVQTPTDSNNPEGEENNQDEQDEVKTDTPE